MSWVSRLFGSPKLPPKPISSKPPVSGHTLATLSERYREICSDHRLNRFDDLRKVVDHPIVQAAIADLSAGASKARLSELAANPIHAIRLAIAKTTDDPAILQELTSAALKENESVHRFSQPQFAEIRRSNTEIIQAAAKNPKAPGKITADFFTQEAERRFNDIIRLEPDGKPAEVINPLYNDYYLGRNNRNEVGLSQERESCIDFLLSFVKTLEQRAESERRAIEALLQPHLLSALNEAKELHERMSR